MYLLKLLLIVILSKTQNVFSTGKFARKLDHYEIVIPKAVDKRGTFLSHVVRNHTNVQNFKHVPSENDLHYELLAFGRVFQLQLISNVEFLSPGFVIESGNLIQTRHGKELREFLNCHYVGRVKNATNSWLAISTCNGLVSTEFFVVVFPN